MRFTVRIAAATACGFSAGAVLAARRRHAPQRDGRLRILHLAFEDFRQPGSGGGSTRTREINHRIAAHHDVIVVTAKYPGCRERSEDGVTYRQLGLNLGRFVRTMTYHLSLPFVVMSTDSDVVIEDFASPVSSMLVPLWTRRPTVAMVQWLWAHETSREYHVPFWVMETLGLKLHKDFIIVGDHLRSAILSHNPSATIDVIPAGIDLDGLEEAQPFLRSNSVVFLGRLQLHGKGLDLLLESYQHLLDLGADVDLVVVGDGHDRDAVERLFNETPAGRRTRFVSWLSGAEKWRYLGSAELMIMPSRYESFGMVALESMAAGTPVVGYAIPALVELIPPDCGILIEPFDAIGLAEATYKLLVNRSRLDRMRQACIGWASTFDWDEAARRQEQVYIRATQRGRKASQ